MLKIGIVASRLGMERTDQEDIAANVMSVLLKGLGKIKHYICVSDSCNDVAKATEDMADKMSVDIVLAIGNVGREIERALSLKQLCSSNNQLLAGMRGTTLILNLQGTFSDMQECFTVAVPILQEGVGLLRQNKGTVNIKNMH